LVFFCYLGNLEEILTALILRRYDGTQEWTEWINEWMGEYFKWLQLKILPGQDSCQTKV
jgi:hypothetical protein